MASETHKEVVLQVTVTTGSSQTLTDIGFNSTQINNAQACTITGTGGDLRYLMDGTTPTTSLGHIIADAETTQLESTGNVAADFNELEIIARTVDVDTTVELDTYE